jgi:dolichyl-phosphate beta-glucosyltransferase
VETIKGIFSNIFAPLLLVLIILYIQELALDSLPLIINYLHSQEFSSELVLVNDGSVDNTKSKLNKLSKKNNIKAIGYKNNRGKGYAIKTGMLSAKGEYWLFTDVDLSTPINEFNKLKPFLKRYDVIIGSRKMPGAKLLKR